MMNIYYFALLSLLFSCSTEKPIFDVNSVKETITENGKLWSKAIQTKDIKLIETLYDDHAHYLPNDDIALHGIDAISSYWKASFNFLIDLQLVTESLEGTKEILYETGHGKVMLLNQTGRVDTLSYKFVNVWKLQTNGSYKVVVDTFNNTKATGN